MSSSQQTPAPQENEANNHINTTNINNTTNKNNTNKKKTKKHPMQHLIGGGIAGLVESSVCHPLDTLKTRMQLRRQSTTQSVQQTVVKLRHSLVEPALRFATSSSFSEPKVAATPQTATTTTTANAFTAASTPRHATLLSLQEPSSFSSSSSLQWKGRGAAPPPHTTIVKPHVPSHVVQAPLGPLGTAKRIIQREGVLALYKGLTAVYAGIIPKMAIRFVSFEQYREWGELYLNNNNNINNTTSGTKKSTPSTGVTFAAGLASGLTEAILVVTPAEVCKIRMQGQYHSLMDPTEMAHRKYTNVLQTAITIAREEGFSALYKGVVPTMLRQGCNQAVNFTAYNIMKTKLLEMQQKNELASWQSLLLGGFSGGMGPLVNNPLDVIKTRLQKQVVISGKAPKYTSLVSGMGVIAREEGILALWKGITPRLLRIVPGQAITFMTYEAVSSQMSRMGWFQA